MSLLKKFVREEAGLELVEYAVMAALIVAAVITAVTALSGGITSRFNTTANTIK